MASSTEDAARLGRPTSHPGEREPPERGASRPLKHAERVDLALLAMPTFALALAITIVSTQLGDVTRHYTHQTTVIGAIIAGEGAMALWVP